MNACYASQRAAAIAALCLLLPVSLPRAGGAAPLALRDICDETTAIGLVGVDTAARTALLELPSRVEGVPGWLVEVDDEGASLFPDRHPEERFGGSAGPGPVLALRRCGNACAEAVEWAEGTWRAAGPRLEIGSGATLHPARDGTGRPWVVEHFPGGAAQTRRAVAWRLEAGRWQPAGSLEVVGAGSPAAIPDPDDPEALISGSGRFTVGRAPADWLRIVPDLAADQRGSLVPLGGGAGAYLTTASRLLLTRDGGRHWFEQRWTPWRDGVTRWDRGEHYWIDLPSGTAASPLALLWFDDRPGGEPALWLTVGTGPDGLVAAAVPRAPRPGGERIDHAIHWGAGEWLLLAGCRRDERTAYLVTRTPQGASAGSWTHRPLEPGW